MSCFIICQGSYKNDFRNFNLILLWAGSRMSAEQSTLVWILMVRVKPWPLLFHLGWWIGTRYIFFLMCEDDRLMCIGHAGTEACKDWNLWLILTIIPVAWQFLINLPVYKFKKMCYIFLGFIHKIVQSHLNRCSAGMWTCQKGCFCHLLNYVSIPFTSMQLQRVKELNVSQRLIFTMLTKLGPTIPENKCII